MLKRKFRRPADFQAEIDSHLQMEADRLSDQGLTEMEARAAARRATRIDPMVALRHD